MPLSLQKLLIGPLDHQCQLGRYVNDPHIQYFVDAHLVNVHQQLQAFANIRPPLQFRVPEARWIDLFAQLPIGWFPDAVIWWHLHYSPLPQDFGDCPVPLIVVVSDWHLSLATVWALREQADWLLVDRPLYQWLQAKGFKRCSPWRMYSFNPAKHQWFNHEERPIDVTYIGNISGVQHPIRHRYLRQLAQWHDRYQIRITSGIRGVAYTDALNQSKIVFNHSIRGEMNLRCYEAAACGALLFIEAENEEVASVLPDRQGAVFYRLDNWLELLEYYLLHTDERLKIVEWAHIQIQHLSYEHHWTQLWEQLPEIFASIGSCQRPSDMADILSLQRQWSHCLFAPMRPVLGRPVQQALMNPHNKTWYEALWNAHAHTMFVYAITHKESTKEALAIWNGLCESAKAHPLIAHNLAWGHYLASDFSVALTMCDQSMTRLQQSTWPWHWGYSGFVLPHPLVMNPWSVAWEQQEASGATAEKYVDLLSWSLGYLVGLCLKALNQLDSARDTWAQTWHKHPALGHLPEQLGVLAEMQQDWSQAVTWYQKELELQPLSRSVWMRLHRLIHLHPNDLELQRLGVELNGLFQVGVFNGSCGILHLKSTDSGGDR